MGIWTIPAVFIIIIICAFSFIATLNVAKSTTSQGGESDSPIPEAIEDNPTMLNPIIWAYAIVGLFMAVVIFYYWSKSSY
ncbi:MAG: short-chain dehydrogenase [Lysinibacillus sp.]